MISISSDVSVKIIAFIDEIKKAVLYELLPLISTFELQASSLDIDEGLVAEIIALLSIYCLSSDQQSKHNVSKQDKTKSENPFNNLIIVLNEIRVQERVFNSNRIRR